MLIFMCMLSFLTVVNAGSHSLMALATYIAGQTPFPEFSVVLMLDDLQILYYDSTTWKAVYRSRSDSKYYDEEQSDAGVVFRDMYYDMKDRAFYLKDHQNHTDGVHVHQRLVGCELLNNGKPGLLHYWDAFGGQNMEEFIFDIEKHAIQIKMPWVITWDQLKRLHENFMYENVYHPICIKTLRRYLNMEKNNVMRKVKPRVRLMKKTLPDSQGLQISCLATGFYPRHINLTLFRDDQPVDDDQITGGEILPNGDGTYQMRKSLEISAEELFEGHNYNCTANYLNLDNKLDITYDVAECDPGSFSLSVVISVLVLMFVAALIITALIIWRKKRCAAGSVTRPSKSHYVHTPMQDAT
ncbi:major histocompatibility complex class I-related gene protein-like [Chanodichthys erythropterus]|uniref:major histocompatibility complex class I-related gene protein-like n=1 Tax=Chanodichthys erythropterus TaxID=933992 RepID=UPI00351F0BAA